MEDQNKQKSIEEQLKQIEQRLAAAKISEDYMEIRDCLLDRGRLLINSQNYDQAQEILNEAMEMKDISPGKKIQVILELMRISVRLLDPQKLSKQLTKCKKMEEEGGDWEKKNKRKVYQAMYCMMSRQFQNSANLFIDTVPTFTATDLISFEELVKYSCIMAIVSLDRVNLRKKIIHSPEILSAVDPLIKNFVHSLFHCKYADFFKCFPNVIEVLENDQYLRKHSQYYVKQIRVVAYSQFLESYKSVTIKNMSKSFGVSVEFIDKEVSHFISIGKLNCKIDKVDGVIQSSRANSRAVQYQKTMRMADGLLNRLQKLARALAV